MCRLHRGLTVFLLCAINSTLFAPAKFTDKASGVVATGTATVKVIKQLSVKGGKVETSKNGTLEGTKVVYTAGKLIQENSTNIDITGEFNPNEDTVTLADQKFNASPGNIAQDVHLSGNSLLEGTPTAFTSSTGVKIAGASSVLNLALTSPLATNIGLNGGTIKLQGSTKLGDGKTPVGNGTLEFNNNSLSFGGTPVTLSGKLLLKKAADLIFNSKVTVTGQLTFDGDGQVSGNGNLMDISLGGTLAIRPNTTIYMTNLKLRGLGLGKIMFYDDTSQLYMSNVEIEMDRNYSITTGGIYMEGPTNIVTKNNRLSFSLKGSLTVDGIALTYDTLTYTNQNNIVPLLANDPHHKFVTVLNDGVIRRLDNFDIISANSNAVVKLSQGGTDGALSQANSNALLYFHRVDSGAIAYLTNVTRTSSNVWTKLMRTNSGAIGYLTNVARTSSNVWAPLIRQNSGAIGYLTNVTRTSSNVWTKLMRTNSGAIGYLTTLARTSSNANLVTIRTTSNSLLFGDRVNSNGVVYLTTLARTSSNASLVTLRTTSNAQLFGDRANSGGVMYLTRLARTSSNANLVTIRTTSNALLFGDRTNSNGVVYLTTLARTNSNASLMMLRTISNALLFGDRANSGGVMYLTRLARTSSNANLVTIRTTSNALLFGDRVNSSAIIKTNQNLTLAYGNSTALLYLNRVSSATIVYWSKTNSNALVYGDRVNSNAVNYLSKTTSNSIYYLANTLQKNSNAINYLSSAVKQNSTAITYVSRIVRTTSQAVLYLNRTTSNSLLYGQRVTSNALQYQGRTNSAALAYGLRITSNALLYGNRTNSAALLYWARTTSNALLKGLRVNSNALLYNSRTTSSALLYGMRIMSNSLLYLVSNISDTILYLVVTLENNSNAIANIDKNLRTDSHAFAYGIANNSSAIVALSATSPLVYATSNALLYLHKVDSDAIVQLDNSSRSLGRANSNALLYLNRIQSNTMLYGFNGLGAEIDALSEAVRTHSNAFAYGIANNSNAIIKLNSGGGSALSLANSNALLYLHRVDSGAIVRLATDVVDLVVHNSSAIVRINQQAQTVFGPEPLAVVTPLFVLSTDVYLSADHVMLVQSGAGACTIDGGGHTIAFANAQTNLLQVDPGIVVTLTNVVLNNYSEAAVLLGSGSSVQFGANVRVALDSDQLVTRDWAFSGGNTMVVGNGNRLTLDTGSIIVRPSSQLRLQAVGIDGLKSGNLRCDYASADLVLENVNLYQSHDMSFTSGSLGVVQDVAITGSNTFSYQSDQPFVVYPNSTLSLSGIGFDYLPPIDNRDLIALVDQSSILSIDGCTLSSSTTGMRLTRGTLVVNHINNLINVGALSLSEGFGFGDGNPDDDVNIQIKPGCSLNLINGMIDYANVN